MANLSAAFAGAGQGLDQLAGAEMQREMMQAQMMRAENLAQLRDYLTTRRQLIVTNARTQGLKEVSGQRISQEHAARDEEEDRENNAHASNEAAAQRRQFANAQSLQNSGFTNQLELGGRQARVQRYRDSMVQASQARADKGKALTALMKYQQQAGMMSPDGGTGLDLNSLAQRAPHDLYLQGLLHSYRDAAQREQIAQQGLNDDPYLIPGVGAPGTPTPPSMPSYLMQQPPDQGPGIADQPYPQDSGADEMYMSSGDGGSGDGSGTGDDEDQ